MLFKLIQTGTNRSDNVASLQGDDEDRKKKVDSKLIDVAHEAMSEKQRELEALVKTGWPVARQKQFKSEVKQKVWDVVSEGFEAVDDDMVEEITERVVEVAEVDPFYKKIFSKE
jgi:hypothetical protein